MALFAIQLVRVVIYTLPVQAAQVPTFEVVIDFVLAINQMLNVIIIIIKSIHLYMLMTFTWIGHRTNDYLGTGFNEIVLR